MARSTRQIEAEINELATEQNELRQELVDAQTTVDNLRSQIGHLTKKETVLTKELIAAYKAARNG